PMPEDLRNASDFPKIIEELAFRGYTKQEIEQIIGGNILRLFEETEWIADRRFLESEGLPSIQPHVPMGEAVSTRTPVLSAEVVFPGSLSIDDVQFRILVDGISYEPEFDEETSVLSLQFTEALQEKFHVITFEVITDERNINRETRIFYIED